MNLDPEAVRKRIDKFGYIKKKKFFFMAKYAFHKQSKRTVRNCQKKLLDYIAKVLALVCKELLKMEKTNNLRNCLNCIS